MGKLLECPFCGEQVRWESTYDLSTKMYHSDNGCIGYKISQYVRPRPSRMGREEFEKMWNTRVKQ